jgi:hypothetical protein
MRRFWIILFILSLNLFLLRTQENKSLIENIRKNSVYFELLGNGAVYSINYDRIIPLKDSLAMYLRIGGNEYHPDSTNELSLNYIGSAGFLIGGPVKFFEPGFGYTYFSGSPDRLLILQAGYRFHGRKGFLFRATPMYIINSEKGDTFGNSLWIGFSFGYSF